MPSKPKESNFVAITVSIRKDQREWLKKHPSISPAGLLQEALDKLIKK
jgi:hypothetical protein